MAREKRLLRPGDMSTTRTPGITIHADGRRFIDSAISDVRAGEALVHRIYDAVRTSAANTGSNALNTLLLITFDEHGGTYDHVPPPDGTPPGGEGTKVADLNPGDPGTWSEAGR